MPAHLVVIDAVSEEMTISIPLKQANLAMLTRIERNEFNHTQPPRQD